MPLILVVETDDRVAARVRKALGREGWNVVHAPGVTEAMQAVASEAPDLFLVAAELEGAGKVLGSFARRQGGPGTVALLAEGSPAPSGAGGADASLRRSFGAGELRAVVERILKTGDRPHGPAAGEPKLTSQDIFGDLVAEVESGAEGFPAAAAAPASPAFAAPASPASATPASPVSPTQPTQAARPAPPKRPAAGDAEIERKLEQTLSGVLGWTPKGKPAPAPAAPPPAPGPGRTAAPPAGPPRPRRGAEDDVDRLISDTLSGLELPGGRWKRGEPAPPPPAAKSAPEAPARAGRPAAREAREEFGLSDLEALLARPRRTPPAPAAPAPPAQPPGPVAEEEPPFRPEPAEPATAAIPGTEFGQYRLLERIGVGGMAEVWKARMSGVEGFQKTVAIKRILPHLTDSPDFVEMFVDEAKLAAQLNHANVIHIYDLGKIGDDYYIAMEHVEGENLRRILERARERGKPMPVGLALYVAARLASALDHAHRKRDFDGRELGLVHRDVSPQNVLVGYEGTIKLCDFGIVKAVSKSSHTQRGALKGKLQYMSPEQAWGRPLDGRSDIFSVGALLFEMLTGRRLFVGESEMEVLEVVRECRITAPGELVPGIPGEVDAIVLRALAREPEDRFQSAGELAGRIEEVLGAMRPSPGQTELSRYLAELFERPSEAAEEGAERPATGAGAAGAAAAAAAAGVPAGLAAPPSEGALGAPPSRPPGETGGAAGAPEIDSAPLVPAVAPVGKVEPEEGGPRGKWLLVAAIVVALVAGALLAWYLLGRRGEGGEVLEPGVREERVEAEGAPPAVPAGAEEGEPPGEPALGPASGAEGDAAAAAEPEEIQRGIEEKLAEREEALRRQFETELAARERALQEQLTELQEREAEPPPLPPAKAKQPPAPAPEPVPKAPVEEVAAPTEAAPARSAAPEPVTPPPPPPRPAPQPPPAPAPEPAPRPAPAVREGALVTMGPGVQPPKLVRFDKPEYPPIARRLRVEDEVVVSVLIDETGKVTDTRLVRGASRDVGLDEAALAAARTATFQPATKDGVRVKMWTTLRIPFRL